MGDATWLDLAIDLATVSVADGGGPFGAVIVRGGVVVATGQNRVTRDHDPTAHAEVVAIRRACADLADFRLTGCTLYASCEPCPLCLSASLWARVDRVVFAADRDDAAAGGFDDRAFYDLFATPRELWAVPVEPHRVARAFDPFAAWQAEAARVAY